MDEKIADVLADYAVRYEKERALMAQFSPEDWSKRVDELLIPIGPVVGEFVNALIKASGAKVILELGMSYGYGSIYLGEAARATGGKVITTELHAGKIAYARKMHERAGLADVIEIRQGDAHDTLRMAKERFDFVLVDLWKDLYVSCLDLFYPKLAPGAYVVADNMINPPSARAEVLAYRAAIKAKPHMESILLPLGNGIEVSRYVAGLDPSGIAPG
jgi:predicted O-methyltransferase YrrM